MLRERVSRWMVAKVSRAVHILPIGDLREHVDTGRTCWCGPRVETTNPETGAPYVAGYYVVIHQALDGRDLVETHGRQ